MSRVAWVKALSIFLAAVAFPVTTLIAGNNEGSTTRGCSQVKKVYMAAEREWSAVNTEVGFMRRELENLRNLRWDTKVTLSVLDEAIHLAKEKGSLSESQLMALNSRIPDKLSFINPDATFTWNGMNTAPLDVARSALHNVLERAEQDLERIEKETMAKEAKSHQMNRRLAELEAQVEQECMAVKSPTPWEQGLPRTTGADIYNRYVDREIRRQIEVENRTQSDIERAWERRYYGPPYPYPYPYPIYPPSPPYSPHRW